MIEVNIHEAKTHLSQLLFKVSQGEEVVIARAGRPIARLLPISDAGAKRMPGSERGKITIAADFDAPLDPETFQPAR
jgi:prevent-host-death family protein